MSAETSGDVCHIKDEDVLRKMWQDTEDFGKKKEIRSHMYKLREERLRNFYSTSDLGTDIQRSEETTTHHDSSLKDINRPNHAQSLVDHSFLSMKTKEIRDSESPTKDMHQFRSSSDKNGNRGWDVVSKREVSDDGKTHTLSKVATTSGSEKIDKGVANYSAKCEQKASVYEDGDANNFTKSSTAASRSELKQEAKGGDDNSNYHSYSTSSSSSSKTVTQHRSSSDLKPLPSTDDSSIIVRKTYTTDVPADLKRNPNYIDGNTTVTTETRTLPDGTKLTTTRYETKGVSSKMDQQKFHTEQKSTSMYDERQSYQTTKQSDYDAKNITTHTTRSVPKSTTCVDKSYTTTDTNQANEKVNLKNQDVRSTHQENRDDVYLTKIIRENEYTPRDTSSTTYKETVSRDSTTKAATTKSTDDARTVTTVRTSKVVREEGHPSYERQSEPETVSKDGNITRTTTVKKNDDGSTVTTVKTTRIIQEDGYVPYDQKPEPTNTTKTTTVKKNDDGSTVTTVRTTRIVQEDGYVPYEQKPDSTRTTTVKKNDDGSTVTTIRTTRIVQEDEYNQKPEINNTTRTTIKRDDDSNTVNTVKPTKIVRDEMYENKPEPELIPRTTKTTKDVDDKNVTTVKTTKIVHVEGYEKQPTPEYAPRDEKPICPTVNRKPGDYTPVPKTPGDFTPTPSTPGDQTPINAKIQPVRPQEIIVKLSPKHDQPITDNNQIIVEKTTQINETSVVPKSPTKPVTEKITSVSTHTTYKTDYTSSKRISVDISPTHDAFVRSLRASPDREQKRGSTRSLKSSTSSLRSSVSPDKKHPDHRDNISPDRKHPSKWPTTKSREPTPTKKSPSHEVNTDTITRRRKTDTHTIERKTTHRPHSRSPSPTTSTSDIEYIRRSDMVTDLDDEEKTTTVTKTRKPTQRPDTLDFNSRQPNKQPSPTTKKAVSPSKTPEKPFKRRDTYEERCKQILGISEQTTDVRKTTERTNSRKNLTETSVLKSPVPKDHRKSPEKHLPKEDETKPKGRKPTESPESKVPHKTDEYRTTKETFDTKTTTIKSNKSFPQKEKSPEKSGRKPEFSDHPKSSKPTKDVPYDKPKEHRPSSKSPDRPHTVNKETDDYYIKKQIHEQNIVTSKVTNKTDAKRPLHPDESQPQDYCTKEQTTTTDKKHPKKQKPYRSTDDEPYSGDETPDDTIPRDGDTQPKDRQLVHQVVKKAGVQYLTETDTTKLDRKSPEKQPKKPLTDETKPKGQKPLKEEPNAENKYYTTTTEEVTVTSSKIPRTRSPSKTTEPDHKPSDKQLIEITDDSTVVTRKTHFTPVDTQPKGQKPIDRRTSETTEKHQITTEHVDQTISTKTTKPGRKSPEKIPRPTDGKHKTGRPDDESPEETYPISEYTDEYCVTSTTHKQPKGKATTTPKDNVARPTGQHPSDDDEYRVTTEEVDYTEVSTKGSRPDKKSPKKTPQPSDITEDNLRPKTDDGTVSISEYTDEYCVTSTTQTTDKKHPTGDRPTDNTDDYYTKTKITEEQITKQPKTKIPHKTDDSVKKPSGPKEEKPSEAIDKYCITTQEDYKTVSTKGPKSDKKLQKPTDGPDDKSPEEIYPVSEYTDEYSITTTKTTDKKYPKSDKPTEDTDDYYLKKKITEEQTTKQPKTSGKHEPTPKDGVKKPKGRVSDETITNKSITTTTDQKIVKKHPKDQLSEDSDDDTTDKKQKTKPVDRIEETNVCYVTSKTVDEKTDTYRTTKQTKKIPDDKKDYPKPLNEYPSDSTTTKDKKQPDSKYPTSKPRTTYQPEDETPTRVVEDSKEFYLTDKTTQEKITTVTEKAPKAAKPTEERPSDKSRPKGFKPTAHTEDIDFRYITSEKINRKTTISKTDQLDKDEYQPDRKPVSKVTEDTDEYYITNKSTKEKVTTTKTSKGPTPVLKDKQPKDDDTKDTNVCYVTSEITTTTTEPEYRKPKKESHDDTTYDFYVTNVKEQTTINTTNRTTPDDFNKQPRPENDDDDEVCYITEKTTDRTTKDSKQPSRKPEYDSPDDTTDFYTTKKTVTQKTTTVKSEKTPITKKPKSPQKHPVDETKPKGSKPSDVTEKRYAANKTITVTTESTQKRPTPSDTRPKLRGPTDKHTKVPTDDTEDTEEHYTTTVHKTITTDRKTPTTNESKPKPRKPQEPEERYMTRKIVDQTIINKPPKATDQRSRDHRPKTQSPEKDYEITVDEIYEIDETGRKPSKKSPERGSKPKDVSKSPDRVYRISKDVDERHVIKTTATKKIESHFKPSNQKPVEKSPDRITKQTVVTKQLRKTPDQVKPEKKTPKTDRHHATVEEIYVRRTAETSQTRLDKSPKDKTKPITTEYKSVVISKKPSIPDTKSRNPVEEKFVAKKTYLTTDKRTVHKLDKPETKTTHHKVRPGEQPKRKVKPEDDEYTSDEDTLVENVDRSSREPSLSPDRSRKVPQESDDFYTLNIKVYKTDCKTTQRRDHHEVYSDEDTYKKKPKSVEPTKTQPEKSKTIYRTEEKHYINKSTKPSNKAKTPKRGETPEGLSPTKQVQKVTSTRRTTSVTDSKYTTKTKPKLEETRHVVTTTIQVVPKSKPQDKKKPTTKTPTKTTKPISQPINRNKPSECEHVTTEEESEVEEYTVDGERTEENRLYNRQITHTISKNEKQPDLPKDPLRKPDKVITTKSIIINNDFENQQQVVVNLQRSKSSRETTPDHTYVCPASDNEDKGVPRYPDEICEPDDVYKRRKPTKLSDIPIIETEDGDVLTSHRVEETDECLLSVNEKVNKFVKEADKLTKLQKPDQRTSSKPDDKLNVVRDTHKRPKSPKCENYPDDQDETFTSVSEKVSHFIETAQKIQSHQKPSHPAPKVKRPEFTHLDETIRSDDCLLSVSDKVNKFTVTAKTHSPDYKKPVSLAKIDEPVSKTRPGFETTDCVQIESEEETYTKTTGQRETSPSKTPTEPDSTPKTSRKVEPKTILSTTGRLRSTESIRKAKEIFESIAKEQTPKKYKPEQKPHRERISSDDVPKAKLHDNFTVTKHTDDLKSTRLVMEKIPHRLSPSKDEDVPHYMRPLNKSPRPHSPYVERSHTSRDRSRSPSVERQPKPHDSSLDNVPRYMWPLNRTPHSHEEHRPHSPKDRSRSPSVERQPKTHESSVDNKPHYMWPLNRKPHEHEEHSLYVDRSRDRSRSPSVEPQPKTHDSTLENKPHYMWPLNRAPHDHEEHSSYVERPKDRSTSPSSERPHYMLPLDRTPHDHEHSHHEEHHHEQHHYERHYHETKEHSPKREPSPSYLKPLNRQERQRTPTGKTEHDTTDKPNKFGIVLRKTDSKKAITTSQRRKLTSIEIENILTTHEIEEIYDIEILEILLERAVNYEQRRRIRAQIRVAKQPTVEDKIPNVVSKKITKTDKVKEPSVEKTKPVRRTEEQTTYSYSERRRSSEVKVSSKEITETHVSRKSPDRKPESKKAETKGVFKTELKRVEPVSKKMVEEKPSWVTQRPLKKPSGDVPKSKPLSNVTKKQDSRVSPAKERKPTDAITSSYGVGPTDENGSPLFGLKALRAQTTTGTTKVQGTVIKSHYYSENGHEPVGEVSVTKYSTDPNDFEGDVEETNGLISVTTTKKFGSKGTPSYKAIENRQDCQEDRRSEERESTTVTRRGSVKQMSKKFIENAVETSKNERQSSYPKAGLILRTSSFKKTATQDSSSREASPETEATTTTVRRTVTTSTSGGRTDTFLNNQKRVSNVQDVITRMRNADDDVQEGDTVEDAEARKLLNKFIGSQVILSGMESHTSSSPSVTTVKRTTTTTSTTSKGGGKPTVITRTFTHPITQEDLDTIWDEQTLKLLLERSTDYEERRIIRGRIRDVMAEKEVCADVIKATEESSGRVEETTEKSKSEGSVTTQVTRISSQQVSKKPLSPFAKFRQLDKQNSLNTPPGTPRTPTGSAPLFKFTDPELSRQASTVKERLLQWCQMKTKEYENVQLDNFSSSWADGLAFCALIHHFLPDAFDYHALTPQDRKHNFTLAFRIADEKANIVPLLDVEDMIATRKPDWKCVFTYVQTIYARFKNED